MEIKLKTTVDTIKNYNAARVTDNEKGGNALLIQARLANIEKRLLAGEERLSKIDGKQALKPPYITKIAV